MPRTFCNCNSASETASGGIQLGGEATLSGGTLVATGGIKCAGTATVDKSPEVFDGYLAAWSLNQTGNGTANEFTDDAPFSLHGQGGSGDSTATPTVIAGVGCSNGQYFDGRDHIKFGTETIGQQQPFTVSLWGYIETFFQARTFYSRGTDDGTNQWQFRIGHSFANTIAADLQTTDGTNNTHWQAIGTTDLQQDKFYHLACSWDGSALRLYVNGTLDTTMATDGTMASCTNSSFAGRWNGASEPTGIVQDIRIYAGVHDATYLLAEHDNICSLTFYDEGDDEGATHPT